ncbi:AbfB domain-containing protein [Lysobacter sp. CCNWLW3]|uniref:AbfB domain-containing protein n=1 Tax=unclassified Lysobacter TaxID=2635362 RepID=UPI002FD5C99A
MAHIHPTVGFGHEGRPADTRPFHRRLGAYLATLFLAPLLLLGATPAVAYGDEAPSNVVAFANSPRWATISWAHSGNDIYWFVLEQESPYQFRQVDADKRAWTVPELQPATTYRFRVCAVYAYNRACSDYAAVTTHAPQAPPPGRFVAPAGSTAFQSQNYPDRFIRHRNWLGELTPVASDLDRADATFFIRRPGLSGTAGSVSLESVNYPGHYLRHQGYRVKLAKNDNSELFRQDASFVMREYDSVERGWWYFESVNYPNHYIRHRNFEMWLDRTDRSDLFLRDSMYKQRAAP